MCVKVLRAVLNMGTPLRLKIKNDFHSLSLIYNGFLSPVRSLAYLGKALLQTQSTTQGSHLRKVILKSVESYLEIYGNGRSVNRIHCFLRNRSMLTE